MKIWLADKVTPFIQWQMHFDKTDVVQFVLYQNLHVFLHYADTHATQDAGA